MMRTTLALLVLGLLIAGCGGSPRHKPPDTPEYHAIQDYERIAGNANLLLSTDRINYVPDRTEPERVSVECRGSYCSVGYSAFIRSNKVVPVFTEDLTLLGESNGVNAAIEVYEGKFNDAHTFGGWMDYSLFASTVFLYTSDLDPDQGVIQAFATITGNTTDTNPLTEATWQGFVSARDDAVNPDLASYVTGDARISVSIDGSVLADVHLSDLANVSTGQTYRDVIFEDLEVTEGQFRRYHADDDRISGAFYGPNHEEVGGVFESTGGLLGSYGGRKISK